MVNNVLESDFFYWSNSITSMNSSICNICGGCHALSLGVPDKYAMERGGWATNSTLKNVYQHTFSEERKQVDEMIDRYFEDALNETEE